MRGTIALLAVAGALALAAPVAKVLPTMPTELTVALPQGGACFTYPEPVEGYRLDGRGVGVTAPSPKTLCLEPSPAWPAHAALVSVKLTGGAEQKLKVKGVSREAPRTWVFQALPSGPKAGKVKPVPPLKPTRGEGAAASVPPGIARFRVHPVLGKEAVYLTYEIQLTGLPGAVTLRPDDLELELCGKPFAGYDLYRRSDDATASQLDPGEVQVGVIEFAPPPACREGRVVWRMTTLAHPQRTYQVQARFAWPLKR